MNKLKFSAGVSLLFPSLAFAHSNGESGFNLVTGLMHTLTGLDHLAVMLGVGILAALMGGKSLYRLPVAFVSFVLIGAVMGVMGYTLAFVEFAIALSVIAMGVMLFSGHKMSAKLALPLVVTFAVFHGMAHGMEVPAGSREGFFAGFISSTVILHIAGIAMFKLLVNASLNDKIIKAAGVIMAVFGVSLTLS